MTISAEKQYTQQCNRVNNFKKQAKELCYANITENLDEFKTTDSKMYWKTIHMLIKNERSVNTTYLVFEISGANLNQTTFCHLFG
jgi:hypothetical protein